MKQLLEFNTSSKNISFFFTKPAGVTFFILSCAFVSAIGIFIYFFIVFDGRVGAENLHWLPKALVAAVFSICVATGSFFLGINGMWFWGFILFLSDCAISNASYGKIFIKEIPSSFEEITMAFISSFIITEAMSCTPALLALLGTWKLRKMLLSDPNYKKGADFFQEMEDKTMDIKSKKALQEISNETTSIKKSNYSLN
jgi:hypothetical protein